MNKKEEFKARLQALNQAFIDMEHFLLSDGIHNDDEINNALCRDFPFKCCFREISAEVSQWVDSASYVISGRKKNKASVNQSVDWNQLMKMDFSKYDCVEINPCCAIYKGEIQPWETIDIATEFERVDENAPDISCWSVYLRLKTGELDNVADFKDKEEAEQCGSFLEKFLIKKDTENKKDEIIHLTNFKPVNVGDIKHIDLRSVFSIRGFSGGFHLLGNSHNKDTWVISQLDADLKYVDNMPYDNEADYLSDVAYLRKAKKGKLIEKKHVNITVSTTVGADVDEEILRQSVDDALNNSDNFTSMIKDHDVYKHGN